ncbi:MAG: ferredoxin reductase family protein [Pseudotabrizicola sp.]|uniref:ferredoxin reductase family protein n=1 Tax=Pseudotabrizicola sp. TaxID=2939647 RepID=UPI00273201B3|nr:ferredoxin reductase family protein [Pseudotabrizicola sp.]MDP2079725.1 ferredoxin reductase family protein [Pseudotabrizicola sp.]MDZ7575688.1 ferredoxin reductase family protein [Pseudotabrizicola sp.]
MTLTGPVLFALAVLAGAILGAQTYAPYGAESAFSIAIGAAAIVAMSGSLILAARPRLIEPFFGGLDRMYVIHKWLGIAALVLMVLHDQIEPDIEDFVRETSLGELAEDVGEIAFYGFIGLIAISWFKRIPFTRLELPWPLWRFTHRFMGLLFAIAAFHQLAIDKPAGLDGTLDLYLNGFSLAGLAAWLFTQFVAPFLRPRPYALDQVARHGGTTEITLRPEGRAMRWRPGQFAFVAAPGAGLSEAHPFTIASAPKADGTLRFGIKSLGDWTKALPGRLAAGQSLTIEGPYGRFLFRKRVRKQVWLAGGIGITPFLAWAEALTDTDTQQIALVWAVASKDEAFAGDRLAAIAARHPGLTVQIVASKTDGRLTAEKLVALVHFPIREAELFFCGPCGLRDGILAGLKTMNQTPRRVHSEAFEFR